MSGKEVTLPVEVCMKDGLGSIKVNALEALKVIGTAYGVYDQAEETWNCRVTLLEGDCPALVVQKDISHYGSPQWETVRTVTDDPQQIQRYMAFRDMMAMFQEMDRELVFPSKAVEHEKEPETVTNDQAPLMDEEGFRSCIAELLGDADPAATEVWLRYAEELDQAETERKDVFFEETCGELQLIRDEYGLDIARQLYRYGQTFTFSPFELRTAAEHLKAGIPIERVAQLSREGDFFTMPVRYHKPESSRSAGEMGVSAKGVNKKHER